ncbi:hypothetical protein XIS1_1040012 [Xenorhabdus innexi]|uniref:Uncharacterized protein n=1 Tax=Xenorhabdus innexi TaxID=290109 RepID=A0A1N6MQJ0_9GAMM|nr:hypothetical protein XIS1_1040012 [Xenorhabdus innexi]
MSVGPENRVITERLLAATAMKTSKFILKKERTALQCTMAILAHILIRLRTYLSEDYKTSQANAWIRQKIVTSLPDFEHFVGK